MAPQKAVVVGGAVAQWGTFCKQDGCKGGRRTLTNVQGPCDEGLLASNCGLSVAGRLWGLPIEMPEMPAGVMM